MIPNNFFYCLENWNKCVCVVWLARWSLVSCHSVWKWLSMRVIAKQQLWRTFTCATFVTGILVMTFFLVLVWTLQVWLLVCVIRKHQSDNHWGFLRHLRLPWRPDEQLLSNQLAYVSSERLLRLRASDPVTDSYFHPPSICCGSSF